MPESAPPKIGVVAGLRADDYSGPPVPRQKWPGGLPISFFLLFDLGPNWSSISFRVGDTRPLCQAVFASELQLVRVSGEGCFRKIEATLDIRQAATAFRGCVVAVDITAHRVLPVANELQNFLQMGIALTPRDADSGPGAVFEIEREDAIVGVFDESQDVPTAGGRITGID